MTMFFIAAFGLAGIFTRFGLDQLAVRATLPSYFMTLAINALGSFLAAVIYVVARERGAVSPELGTGAIVGFCGGFTTFSAYSLQAISLYEQGQALVATLYLLGSPVVGAIAVSLGLTLARR